jgi:hypothetical protein
LIGIMIMGGIILLISKLADVAQEAGHFWLFLALTIAASGLLLAATRVVTQVAAK